jgi:ABC-type transport system involved in multi-copper enzyme maturation permease subunit
MDTPRPAASLLQRSGPQWLGPVAWYDMVRTARRGRYVFLRTLYAVILFILLNLEMESMSWQGRQWSTTTQLAMLANFFFAVLVRFQFTAVILLTPAYTFSAISEEKERRTLWYLLATDLRSREIILGKFCSRLANMSLLLLTGFPIVALTELLGGIDPNLLLIIFAATLLIMCSLAALTMLWSLYSTSGLRAVMPIYLGLFLYLIGLPILHYSLSASWRTNSTYNLLLRPVLDFIDGGNPFYAFGGALSGVGQRPIIDEMVAALVPFSVLHLLFTGVCLLWAILKLRQVAMKEASKARKTSRTSRRARTVSDRPVLWKESRLRGLPHGRQVAGAFIVTGLAALVTLGPVVVIFWEARMGPRSWSARDLAQAFNVYVRMLGTIVTCALLIGIALKASTAIPMERVKNTLDTLLSTPLPRHEILFGKWLGSILCFRYFLMWPAAIWAIGLCGHGLDPLALPVLAVALAIYAMFAASSGLLASVLARGSMQAQLLALGTIFCLTLGHWLVWPLLTFRGWTPNILGEFERISFTPPYTIGLLAFYPMDFESNYGPWNMTGARDGVLTTVFFVVVGLAIWSALAACFYWQAGRRFCRDGPVGQPFLQYMLGAVYARGAGGSAGRR